MRRESDAFRILSPSLAVADTRLAHSNRADAGHDLTLRQMTVPHDALAAIFGLQIAMLGKKVRHLRFHRMDKKRLRPVAQNLGEWIADGPWLNQLDDVIGLHGVSFLQWRSGGLNHHHDTPPSSLQDVTNFRQ